jgi:hypothetical protein
LDGGGSEQCIAKCRIEEQTYPNGIPGKTAFSPDSGQGVEHRNPEIEIDKPIGRFTSLHDSLLVPAYLHQADGPGVIRFSFARSAED